MEVSPQGVTVTMSFHDAVVPVRENTDVAHARRVALGVAHAAGLDESDIGSLGIVITEAGTNLLKHGGGGEILVRPCPGTGPAVEVLAIDRGKGMANIERCLEDGYSTAGSPGNGLGAIRRRSMHFDCFSAPEQGTVLLAQVGTVAPAGLHETFVVGAICAPAPSEEVSGDAWLLQCHNEACRVFVADGLGHGPAAAEAAQAGIRAARENPSSAPGALIDIAHARMRATRGAAIAVAEIRPREGQVCYSGVGNISGSIISESNTRRQMVSMNGTAGHEMRAAREFQYPWESKSLLVLHSDGLNTHWSIDRYAGLFRRHPSIIAGVLFRDSRRGRDDATVVVVRQLN
jgi:anti-sigma regulatory factor (Ser/Thr protein kinase)